MHTKTAFVGVTTGVNSASYQSTNKYAIGQVVNQTV